MDSSYSKDYPRAIDQSLGTFEFREVGKGTDQEAIRQVTATEETTSAVSVYANVEAMDGQVEERVAETSMAPA